MKPQTKSNIISIIIILACMVVLLVGAAHCQVNYRDRQSQLWGGVVSSPGQPFMFASGQFVYFDDYAGTTANTFEIIAGGTAASTLTATIAGCMPGGTCSSALGTSSGVSSQFVQFTSQFPYSRWKITVSWTGGDTTTTFQVNRLGVPTGTGGGSGGAVTANITQFGSSNVVTGTGASGAGIPRVTVSNDSSEAVDMTGTVPGTAPADTRIVGMIYNSARPGPTAGQTLPLQSSVQGALYTSLMGTADAGTGLTSAAPGAGSLTTSVNVKASAGNVYGMSVTNGAASVCWIQFINSAGAGTLGTGAIFSVALPASGTVNIFFNFPVGGFTTGIAVGISTTQNGSTACGTAGSATVWYK